MPSSTSPSSPADTADGTSTATSPPPGRKAAQQVQRREHLSMALPLIGNVELPHPQDLAYYAGVATLVALEVLEWPVAVALAAGHALTSQHHNRVLEEFGEALEER